ncbi:MAG: tetratricopeptide repeat protein [Phycisphaerales bacterium]|nr:tetratricopeptide repeat protein [Phycisphaerales bacterium]
MRSTPLRLLAYLIVLLTTTSAATAQKEGEPIVIGRRVTVHSDILGEDRPIVIHLPTGYDRSQTHYPVLYMLDAEFHFAHVAGITDFLAAQGEVIGASCIPQMIVVGIENVNRGRDLAPQIVPSEDQSQYVPAGDSERFIRFMEDELIPFVDAEYRTEPYRILAGHCLAGLFTVHMLLASPDTFGGYIAITPYLLEGDELPLAYVQPILEQSDDLGCSLHVVAGAESDAWVDKINRFAAILEETDAPGLRWQYQRMTDTGHGAEVHQAVYDGLEAIYAGWGLSREVFDRGLDAIEAHYQAISDRFGYGVRPPEAPLNQLGYVHLGAGDIAAAVRVFKRNVELHPESWNVYDSLGEAYTHAGDRDRAIELYEKSLRINPDNMNGKEMLKRLRESAVGGS